MRIKGNIIFHRLRSYYCRFFRYQKSKDFYISKVSRKAPWVYIAYIADVFYHLDDENYLSSHQNKREAVTMVGVFNEMGFNVYVQNYLSKRKVPNISPKIIIGLEPNIVRAAMLYPNAWKIYYATGAYGEHQNNQIKYITDNVNKKYGTRIPYRRLVDKSILEAYAVADDILMIGSKYTIKTFPEELRSKITTIHQSTQLKEMVSQIKYSPDNEFFFMGSSGNLLKGLSLLIEYFSEHTELILNVVGPIEDDVKTALCHKITENIILHGYVDVNSERMTEITNKCNFIVYPSGSEGMPGAVLNSMKCGLIPIVTRWAAFDEIGDYGYVMNEWNTKSIHEGILWAFSMSIETVLARKKECVQYVNEKYNLKTYRKELFAYISKHEDTL